MTVSQFALPMGNSSSIFLMTLQNAQMKMTSNILIENQCTMQIY